MIEGHLDIHDADPERKRAMRDALRSIRSLPTPEEAATWLNDREVAALHGAGNRRGMHITHPYTADPELMRSLRLMGMVEINGAFLTVFGVGVRRYIVEREI